MNKGISWSSQALEAALKVFNSPKSPIVSFYRNPHFYDEPLLYQYSTKIYATNKGKIDKKNFDWGGGMSFNQEKAAIKAFGEGIERFCLGIYNKSKFLYRSISDSNLNFLNPVKVVSFSQKQKKDDPSLFITDNDKFFWVKGYSLLNDKEMWIPAQLVYVPYDFSPEKTIRFPISTGAAAGVTIEDAIYRGICEIIERDSFMIFYLNKLSPPVIDIRKYNGLEKIYDYFYRYKLEIKVFDMTTDLMVPVVISIIIDKTGIGPYLSIGLKSSLDFKEAIIGSIEEAQHTRPWMRDEMAKVKRGELNMIKNNPFKISDPRERGLYWYDGKLKDTLNFFLESNNKTIIYKKRCSTIGKKDKKDKLKIILKQLKLNKCNPLYVDITPKYIFKNGFCVVKVIIPELQPLYLEEKYRYLGGRRLYEVPKTLGYKEKDINESELNDVPHPFL